MRTERLSSLEQELHQAVIEQENAVCVRRGHSPQADASRKVRADGTWDSIRSGEGPARQARGRRADSYFGGASILMRSCR